MKYQAKSALISNFNLNESALIEASAGTGKTFTITYLVLRLLLGSGKWNGTQLMRGTAVRGPLELENILIVTFTKAATSDLRARVREKIREAREIFEQAAETGKVPEKIEEPMADLLAEFTDSETRRDAARVLLKAERSVDDAAICTIHSFCNSALNQIYALEAGEAFENSIVDDLSLIEDEAYHKLWRRIFYRENSTVPKFLLELLQLENPWDIKKYVDVLGKVRLTNPKSGILGFRIENTELLDAKYNSSKVDQRENLYKLFEKSAQRLIAAPEELAAKLPAVIEELKKSYSGGFIEVRDGKTFIKGTEADVPKNRGGAVLSLIQEIYQKGELTLADIDNLGKINLNRTDKESLLNGRLAKDKRKAALPVLNSAQADKDYAALCDFTSVCHDLLSEKEALKTQASELKYLLATIAQAEVDALMRERKLMSNDDILRRLDLALNYRGEVGDRLVKLIRSSYPVAIIDEFQDTDPTQFSIFSRLYLSKEAAGKARCYLIGDPKQSIYAFRGSDINSYLKAREAIEALHGGKGGVKTLNCNYRSAPKVVEGVNELFMGGLNPSKLKDIPGGAFLTPRITFEPVNHDKGKYTFRFLNEELGAGTYFEFLDVRDSDIYKNNPPKTEGTVNKGTLGSLQAKGCAQIVKRILEKGVLTKSGSEDLGIPNVRPGDIAILVRKASEYNSVAEELSELKISAVYYSDRSSVLFTAVGNVTNSDTVPSKNANAMLYLMEAMAEPANRRLLRRLLGSSLLSLDGEAFLEALGEENFEREVRLLNEAQSIWRRVGFLAAFSNWFSVHDGVHSLLTIQGGERDITDYYHIAELIQEKQALLPGVQAQLRWYQNLLNDAGSSEDVSSEMVQKRLESERDQVQVRTIHNSKGLEFPIVLMPFLWSWQKIDPDAKDLIYYNNEGSLTGLTLDLKKEDAHKNIYVQNELEENARLAYVALTRACAANFIFVSNVYQSSTRGYYETLVRLLCRVKDKTVEKSDIDSLFERIKAAGCTTEDIDLNQKPEACEQRNNEADGERCLNTISEEALKTDFAFVSYTSITRTMTQARLLTAGFAEDDKNDADEDETLPVQGGLDWRFYFPRGTRPGDYLHRMMEKCPFDKLRGNTEEMLLGAAQDMVQNEDPGINHRWQSAITAAAAGEESAFDVGEGDLIHRLADWLKDIVCAPLVKDLSLSSLEEGCYIPEMDYLLPLEETNLEDLNVLVKENAVEILERSAGRYSAEEQQRILNRKIRSGTIKGFMNGSLDLVLTFGKADNNRFYVVDYKSNYLGESKASYHPVRLERSLFEHKYDVQYLFYSLALHRLLKSRISDYDYDRDFGGVMYLYLRGLHCGDGESGIYRYKVKKELIEKLDRLFTAGA